MSFLLFNFCYDMKINGLDYDKEFEVLLEWDEELKVSYNEIFEDEDENTSLSASLFFAVQGVCVRACACVCVFERNRLLSPPPRTNREGGGGGTVPTTGPKMVKRSPGPVEQAPPCTNARARCAVCVEGHCACH